MGDLYGHSTETLNSSSINDSIKRITKANMQHRLSVFAGGYEEAVHTFPPNKDAKGELMPKTKEVISTVIDLPNRAPRPELFQMKEIGHLRIEVLKAELTRGEENFSKMDPYVICETSDIRIRTLQQTVKKSYRKPKWN